MVIRSKAIKPDTSDSAKIKKPAKSASNSLKREDLVTIISAAKKLSNIKNIDAAAKTVLEILVKSFPTKGLAIYEYSGTDKCFCPIRTTSTALPKQKISFEELPIWDAFQEGKFISFPNKNHKTTWKDVLGEQDDLDFEPVLLVPLIYNRFTLGMIVFAEREDSKAFSRHELALLNQLRTFIKGSFNAAATVKQMISDNIEKNKQLDNLKLLQNIGRSIILIDKLKSLLVYILRQVLAITRAEEASILIYSKDTDRLQTHSVEGAPDNVVQKLINDMQPDFEKDKTFLREKFARKAFDEGNPIYIDQFRDSSEFSLPGKGFVKSASFIPLQISGEGVGVIQIINRKKEEGFSKIDKEILEAVANQAAIAINRARLHEEATTDLLTGLNNRRYFLEKAGEQLNHAQRYEHPFSIAMLDIDKFKSVNDTYGHDIGDEVLKVVSDAINNARRESDLLARFGGEEFILFLPESNGESAFVGLERIRIAVEELEIVNIPQVTISCGIGSFPEGGSEIEEIIKKADLALYDAKENGRNRVEIYKEKSGSFVSKIKSGFLKRGK